MGRSDMDQIQDGEDMVVLIRRFAAAEHFRSATVDELELADDGYPRPLRPEDLEFIDFTVPVAADTICDLPSLAAQRTLRCIYDMQIARLPRSGSMQTLERRAEFYNDASRIMAVRLAPSLERFAFGFLEQPCRADGGLSQAKLLEEFERFARDANTSARASR